MRNRKWYHNGCKFDHSDPTALATDPWFILYTEVLETTPESTLCVEGGVHLLTKALVGITGKISAQSKEERFVIAEASRRVSSVAAESCTVRKEASDLRDKKPKLALQICHLKIEEPSEKAVMRNSLDDTPHHNFSAERVVQACR